MRRKNKIRLRNVPAWLSAAVVVGVVGTGTGDVARADEGEARNLLKAMSDYMAGETTISFNYDSDLEVVTSDLQKLKFASSGTVSLSRPDKIRVTRTGGFADVEMVFDGKQLTVLGKNLNRYAQVDAGGTIDQLVDHLRIDLGVEAPGADLLLSNVYDQLMEAVVDVKDLGSGVIGGVECNHLALRTTSVDWEIWIAMGDRPYPCRYVVTSKLVAQAPEYRLQISDWTTGSEVAADDFSFSNPGGATKVDLSELQGVDELPDLAAEGGAQ
jgi:hypothetical protein